TTEGKRPRARLIIEADGAAAEYQIYLRKDNAVELRFSTTNRTEAERRAVVLRAVGVRAEVKKIYNKTHGRDEWYINITANTLASESVHEVVRRAVAEFLRLCREAGAIEEKTYSHLTAKFEKGAPEWGDVRFSVRLREDGFIDVVYQTREPQSFNKAVEFLRGVGMRDSCEGDWCIVHFTAREPREGGKGYIRIYTDGLRYIGWLASRGDERAQWLRDMLLKEAERKGEEVRKQLEQRFNEWEQWGRVKPPIEREVEVEGKKVRVGIEEVEAWREKSEKKEHLVVKVRAEVADAEKEITVEKEVEFFKRSGGRVHGYVNIYADAEGGHEADYIRTAAVLKALEIEEWSVYKDKGKPKQIQLTGGALDALMRLEPVCAALDLCRRGT
ncbi:MAG: PaRep2b protein, partial [Pyrobaculum sp.]